MKIAITDLETTGLNSYENEIIEIGLVIIDSESFEILDTMDMKVKPLHPEIFHPKAYALNGYNEEEWKDAVPLEDAIKIYADKTEGAMFCAHNPIFDWSFIEKAFSKFNIENKFDRHVLDIFSLAWSKIPQDKMTSWSMKSICEYLEIPPEPDMHRALNGAMREYEIYKKLMKK